MALKKTSGRSESSLHIGFAIGSFMLLATTVYVFVQDHYGREFPKYQDLYRDFELKRLAEERKKANAELGEAEFEGQIEGADEAASKRTRPKSTPSSPTSTSFKKRPPRPATNSPASPPN